eukprot:GEMP01064839.1.p1 GENE.GEMP01064839.1~~GEMP01064839.1.p1  ORF type:complete len:179 (+),score=23.98 GEMP01064839.1:168-704(+)
MADSSSGKEGRLLNCVSLVFYVLAVVLFCMDIGTLAAPIITWPNGEESAFGPAYRFASGGLMWLASLLLNVMAIFITLFLQLTRYGTKTNKYPVAIVLLFVIAAEFYRLFAFTINASYISEDVVVTASDLYSNLNEPRLLHVSQETDLSMGPGGQMSIVSIILGLVVIPLVPMSLFRS